MFRIKERVTFADSRGVLQHLQPQFPELSDGHQLRRRRRCISSSTGLATSGFGWINTSVTNIQTGGAIPTTRNGQIVARLTW